jgi:hypothetical protein
MNPQSISNNTFQLRNDTASVAGLVTYSDSTATFQPSSNLAYSSNYTASISDNVENLAGQTIPDTHEWSFSTIAAPPGPDVTPPRVVNRTPEVDGENISVNTTVQISFNEPINLETLNSNTFFVTSEESPVEGTVSYDNQVAIFDPDEPLDFATSYTATLDETVEDTAGNAIDKDVRWTFTTEAIPDSRAPSVTSTEPADGQSDIATNSTISVMFSEAMDPESLNSTSFILRQGSTGISGSVSYANKVARFTPSGTLAFDNRYTATITTTASDLAGNPLNNNFSWRFYDWRRTG